MDKKFNKSLLPDFIKKPVFILLVYILPQVVLLSINLWSYWLISDEVLPEKVHIAYSILAAEMGLLCVAFFVWLYSWAKKSMIGLIWNAVFLVTHIGYLWYMSSNLWHLIPNNIEPWILDQGMLIFYQFTFIMPGLFYAGLRLACFDLKIKKFSDVGFSILITILAPVTYYTLFIGVGRYFRSVGWKFSELLAIIFFVGTTVVAFVGLIRLVVLTYNYIRSKGDLTQIIFAVIIAIVGPIAGLLLNKTIPFPANFQTPWVYVLAIINGLIVIIPNVKKTDGHGYLLFARTATYPFTFYFFLVFLPFLPISLPAIFAVGMGFLILVPVVLFLLHTKKIHDNFKICHQAHGILFSMLLVLFGLSLLPGYFTYQAIQDKAALKSALKYVYSPNYKKDFVYKGSVKSIQRTLINLKQFKDGIQLPYLSGFYNRMVFEGMVLPDKKIHYLYKLFVGEELKKELAQPAWGFDGFLRGDRGRRLGVRPASRDRNVALTSFEIETENLKDITKSRIHLKMNNLSESDTAEFFRELNIPQSVLITDFQLMVNDEMVPGRIFEKRAALWVYHMIRDFTRRDPGILTYKSPERVHFNIYPFLKNQTREAILEFTFPQGLNPVIQFGNDSIFLDKERSMDTPIFLSQVEKNTAAIIIPKNKLKQLHSIEQKAYLHFILDFSKGTEELEDRYIAQILDVIKKYGDQTIGFGRLSAANYNLQEATPSYIDLGHKNQIKDALNKISIEHQGSLNLGRVIKHHLTQERKPIEMKGYSIEPYPLFVVITNNQSRVLEVKDMDFFQTLLPYENEYLVSTEVGHIDKKYLWSQQRGEVAEEMIVLSFGDVVSYIPAEANQPFTIEFKGNFEEGVLKVLNPSNKQFENINNIKIMDSDTEYVDGLKLNLENMEILHNPAIFEQSLSSIVDSSRELGIMSPSTSFIIVERSSQWKILKIKEKQRLATTEGLEFEEDFDTPSPSVYILLILLFVWYFLRNRLYIGLFKKN
ncbi:hypothetical protein MNBD_UNCLBAC01-222 [hydrothermal vent metagenome]|uniref:VIT domain-containing protein n=1 Tax=hydrothermal vent metagenome TaxID=652676 RepID=A0A3B1D6U4_9ZZZZ